MPEAVAIIGVGESEYSWESGRSELELAVTAVRAALADAGVDAAAVDGMMRYSIDTAQQSEIAPLLGIETLKLSLDATHGAASAVSMLAASASAIRAGDAQLVVCFRSFNGRSRFRLGRMPLPPQTADGHVLAEGPLPFGGEFSGPYGSLAPGCMFGLWTRAYMDRYRISEARMADALASIVIRQRRYAARNPRALLRDKPIDRDGYLESRVIAEPLRKPDLCLETDGACAVVLAGEAFIDRTAARPVYLLGTAQCLLADYFNFFLDCRELPPRLDRTLLPRLLEAHGLSHADVDVLGIYDAASPQIIFDLEGLGFCDYGEGLGIIDQARPAINTSGGLLAEVYLQGMNQLIEIVRQLRGDSSNQIADARIGALSVAGVQGVALLGARDG